MRIEITELNLKQAMTSDDSFWIPVGEQRSVLLCLDDSSGETTTHDDGRLHDGDGMQSDCSASEKIKVLAKFNKK